MTPDHAHRRYLPPAEPRESRWKTWLIGGLALTLWFYFLLFQLPALVAR